MGDNLHIQQVMVSSRKKSP